MRIINATWILVSSVLASVVALATIVAVCTAIAASSGSRVRVPGLVTAAPGAGADLATATVDQVGSPYWFLVFALLLGALESRTACKTKLRRRSSS